MLEKDFRYKSNNKSVLHGVMKFLIVCLVLVLGGFTALYLTKLENITIEGNSHYTNEEIIDLLMTSETDKNSLLFYLNHLRGKNDNIPFIEKIDVKLTNRNEIHLQVYEKIITGSIEYMESYMYFDREGIIVETSCDPVDNIPLVTGLKFKNLILHQPIEVDKPNVFNVILNLTHLIHSNEINVNRIHFTNELEVILFSDDVRVLLGRRDSYDEQVSQLPNLLSSLYNENTQLAMGDNKKLLIDMKEFKEGQERIIATPIE